MPIRCTAVAEPAPAPAAFDSDHDRPGGLTRRSMGIAAVGTVALLAGCADPRTSPSAASTSSTATAPSGSPTPPADEELVTSAVSAERLMVEQLTAAAGVEPLARTVLAARVVHAAHVELLDEAAKVSGPSRSATMGTAPTSPTGTATPSPAAPSPAAPTATAAALARAERALVDQHTTAAVAASSGILARVLAAMAASAAQQAVALEQLTRLLATAEDPS